MCWKPGFTAQVDFLGSLQGEGDILWFTIDAEFCVAVRDAYGRAGVRSNVERFERCDNNHHAQHAADPEVE